MTTLDDWVVVLPWGEVDDGIYPTDELTEVDDQDDDD